MRGNPLAELWVPIWRVRPIFGIKIRYGRWLIVHKIVRYFRNLYRTPNKNVKICFGGFDPNFSILDFQETWHYHKYKLDNQVQFKFPKVRIWTHFPNKSQCSICCANMVWDKLLNDLGDDYYIKIILNSEWKRILEFSRVLVYFSQVRLKENCKRESFLNKIMNSMLIFSFHICCKILILQKSEKLLFVTKACNFCSLLFQLNYCSV